MLTSLSFNCACPHKTEKTCIFNFRQANKKRRLYHMTLNYHRKFLSMASGFMTCFSFSDLCDAVELVDKLSPGNLER